MSYVKLLSDTLTWWTDFVFKLSYWETLGFETILNSWIYLKYIVYFWKQLNIFVAHVFSYSFTYVMISFGVVVISGTWKGEAVWILCTEDSLWPGSEKKTKPIVSVDSLSCSFPRIGFYLLCKYPLIFTCFCYVVFNCLREDCSGDWVKKKKKKK